MTYVGTSEPLAGHPRIVISLLGELRVHGRAGPVAAPALSGRRVRAALAYLASRPGKPIGRRELALAIWAELPPTWDPALRSALTGVRKVLRSAGLPDETLATREGWVRLGLPLDAATDVQVAESLTRRAEEAARLDEVGVAMDLGSRAAQMLAIGLLPGIEAVWVDDLRSVALDLRIRALEALATACLKAEASGADGNTRFGVEAAIDAAEAVMAIEPLRESAHRTIISAHLAAGRRGDALRAYERLRVALADALGVIPADETEALYRSLLGPSEGITSPSNTPDLPAQLRVGEEWPFVGRAGALDLIDAWVGTIVPGSRMAVIQGESGVGKSRLAREIASNAHDHGIRVAYSRCDDVWHGAISPLIAVLRHLVPGDELVQIVDRASDAGVAWPGPDDDRDLLLDDIAGRLVGFSNRHPVLLIIDDLQWAGASMIGVLHRLLADDARCRVAILATVRDVGSTSRELIVQLVADARRRGRLLTVELEGLAVTEIESLLRAIGGGHAEGSTSDIAAELHRLAAGNSLYVTEAIRSGLASGALAVASDGRWSGAAIGEQIAAELGQLFVARASALGDGALDLLRIASVAGEVFDVVPVATAAGMELDRAIPLFDAALDSRLLRSEVDRPGSCRFAHQMVRLGLQQSLSPLRQTAAHRRLGLALEHHGAPPAILARHFVAAASLGETERAVRWSLEAAAQAIEAFAYEEVPAIVERALGVASDQTQRARLLIAFGEAGIRAGDASDAHQALLDAVAAARRGGDGETLAEAALAASRGYREGSEWSPEASRRALAVEALHTIGSSNDELRVRLLGQIALWTPGTGERQKLATEALAIAERLGTQTALIAAFAASRVALWEPAATQSRAMYAVRVAAAATERGEHHLLATVLVALAGDRLQSGDLDAVRASLRDLDASGALTHSRRLRWQRRLWDVTLETVAGNLDAAERCAKDALLTWGDAPHLDAFQAFGPQLALLRLLQGRLDEMIDSMVTWTEAYPDVPAYRAMLAWAFCEMGRYDDGAHVLQSIVGPIGAGLAEDNTWPVAVLAVAEACAALHRGDIASRLLEPAQRMSGQLLFQPGLHLFFGPADHAIGLLAAAAGQREMAHGHLDRAVIMSRRIGGAIWERRSFEARHRLLGG